MRTGPILLVTGDFRSSYTLRLVEARYERTGNQLHVDIESC